MDMYFVKIVKTQLRTNDKSNSVSNVRFINRENKSTVDDNIKSIVQSNEQKLLFTR